MNTFKSLELIEPLLRSLAEQGYQHPTPIQAKAIPVLLKGNDVLGCAQTGTGKTAAFLLPILHHLSMTKRPKRPLIKALILTPTRELAAQIGDNFEVYAKYLDIDGQVIFGGVNQKPQVEALKKGVDVLIATPGRLLDLQSQGHLDLSQVSYFVLDEADRMLDMGFIVDIKKVIALLPKRRQTLLFSATMPKTIADLANRYLHHPIRVEVNPESTTVDAIKQSVMFVEKDKKTALSMFYTIQVSTVPSYFQEPNMAQTALLES